MAKHEPAIEALLAELRGGDDLEMIVAPLRAPRVVAPSAPSAPAEPLKNGLTRAQREAQIAAHLKGYVHHPR